VLKRGIEKFTQSGKQRIKNGFGNLTSTSSRMLIRGLLPVTGLK